MTELPSTLSVSKRAYRMFASMCKTTHEGEGFSTKDKNEKSGNKPFSTLTQAFLIAVAVGIVNNQKIRPEDSAQLIRGDYLRRDKNFDCFKQLIKSKYEAKTEVDVANLMVQFAEFGITELYDEFHKTGDIDFVQLSRLADKDE
jgi:hypothetical protein